MWTAQFKDHLAKGFMRDVPSLGFHQANGPRMQHIYNHVGDAKLDTRYRYKWGRNLGIRDDVKNK